MTRTSVTGARIATPVFWGSMPFVFLNFGLPIYTRELGADAVQIGGMFTVFTVTMLVLRPLVGWALDRIGRRWFFVGAFAFYAVSMATFSQAEGMVDFYVARLLQGLGASLMWISARTIIGDVTTAANRGEEMGRLTQRSVQGSMMGGFYGFSLVSMMPMTEAWVLAFAGYSATALLGIAFAWRVPETKTASRESDDPVVLSAPVKRLMVIFALTGFATALLDPIYLIFLQDKFDLPMIRLAMAFFPAGIVYALLPRHAGKLADRFGRAPMMVVGMLAGAAVAIGLPWFPHILWVAVFYTLYAVGGALWGPAESALLGDLATDATRGRVFGMSEAATALGAAVGPLAGGFIYEYVAPQVAFALAGGMLTVGAVLVAAWFRQANQSPEHA